MLRGGGVKKQVVSIDLFCSHFVCFCTMESVMMCLSFLQMTSVLVKKVPMENGNSIFLGGTIILLALFGQRDILSWS